MNRASLRNEGKIHLGLIYANDPSLATVRLQLRGALQFKALLRRWIGARADALSRSTTFFYLVARDSVLSPDVLRQHYFFVEISLASKVGVARGVCARTSTADHQDVARSRPVQVLERDAVAKLQRRDRLRL
jgi:hypothetical protein